MFQLASGILGAAAATLAFSTVHLEVSANGDLQRQQSAAVQSASAPQVVRTAKGDRLSIPAVEGQNLTVSFRVPGEQASSVIMRVALPNSGQKAAPPVAPAANRASTGKRMVACEPSVSVLTPVAKVLQPSRCVT
jgi:hypothetical protein